MLVKGVIRSGARTAQLPALRVARTLSTSRAVFAEQLNAETATASSVLSPKSVTSAKVPSASLAKKALPTAGRKSGKTRVVASNADKVKYLLKWTWLDPEDPRRTTLASSVETGSYPEWLDATYESVRNYRLARARLWTPTVEELKAVITSEHTDPEAWLHAELQSEAQHIGQLDREQQIDYVLRKVWQGMDSTAQEAALVRARFECIQRLGWRQGYSSGYPEPKTGGESHLPEKFGAASKEGRLAFKKLQEGEKAKAWAAWQAMTPAQRIAEEKGAWAIRDRSQLYMDDTETSTVLGGVVPRWFAVPERAGVLNFLPNTIVRLVKNHTRAGEAYDPWKATFRVPLNMHKHGLRTYLLHIYGLKTTWARSSIYRSPVTRSGRTYQKIVGRDRTFKKVEVGLLEPFLFPETSPDFKKRELFESELDFEQRLVYMKMTKSQRWRGRKDVAQYETEIANRHKSQYHKLDAHASEGLHESETEELKKFPRLIVRSRGVPSASHGKILQLLSEDRKKKEELINQRIAELRQESLSSRDKASLP